MNTNWVSVDTHKETLACYKDGKFKEFKTTQNGFEQLTGQEKIQSGR